MWEGLCCFHVKDHAYGGREGQIKRTFQKLLLQKQKTNPEATRSDSFPWSSLIRNSVSDMSVPNGAIESKQTTLWTIRLEKHADVAQALFTDSPVMHCP